MPPVGRAGRARGGCGPCLPRRQAPWKTLRPAQGVLAKIHRKSLPAPWEGAKEQSATPQLGLTQRDTFSSLRPKRKRRHECPADPWARPGAQRGPRHRAQPLLSPGAVGAARAPQAQITCWSARPLCPQARPSLPALCLPHRLARQAAPVRTGGFTDKAEVLHCKTDKTIKPHPGAGQAVSSPGTFLEGEPCNPGPLPPATCATRDGDTLSLTPPPPTNCGSKAPRGARDPLGLVPVTPANWSARRPAKPRLLAGPGHSLPRAPASHTASAPSHHRRRRLSTGSPPPLTGSAPPHVPQSAVTVPTKL